MYNLFSTDFQSALKEAYHQTNPSCSTIISKSSAMSKAIHTIVICIMLTNFSIQKNLETYNSEALKTEDPTSQQLAVIEERRLKENKGMSIE